MNTRVRIYQGNEIGTSYKGCYENKWDWKNCPDMEKIIEQDKLYAVKENYEEWESHGLAGDGEGESHEVLYIEEVPEDIVRIVDGIKTFRHVLSEYESQVFYKDVTPRDLRQGGFSDDDMEQICKSLDRIKEKMAKTKQ